MRREAREVGVISSVGINLKRWVQEKRDRSGLFNLTIRLEVLFLTWVH
jgi:hypothetical protein